MLKNFKNNKSAKRVENAKKQKALCLAKNAIEKKQPSPPSSDTEVDSDSDSEYEEILISSLNGQPKKKAPPVQSKVPAVDEPNHANHFTESEPTKPAEPTPVVPKPVVAKPKPKARKKIVIKKYYQQRQPPTDMHSMNKPPTAVTPEPAARMSYIGIANNRHTGKPSSNAHSTMSSRILNW